MNRRFAIGEMLLCLLLLSGCEQPQPVPRSSQLPPPATEGQKPETKDQKSDPATDLRPLTSGFTPARIEILPLTELTNAPAGQQGTQLSVYVSLLDVYGSQMKTPGTLRFELYEYVARSAQAKGQRIAIWPDIDATTPAENQKYWRDFLRAYEFTLPGQAARGVTYVLQVTCLLPSGKRLTDEFILKPEN